MANAIMESYKGMEVIPIEDMLLRDGKIFLTESIDRRTAAELLKKLMYLETCGCCPEITFYINSPGGEVISGLGVYDYIRSMKTPVRTVCAGDAASMGAILFLAGRERLMLPHTRLLIHDPSYGYLDASGKKPHEIQQEVDSLNKIRSTLAEIISEKTGRPQEEIYEVTANDTFFTAEEAVEFGLATGIVKGECI